MSSPFPGMDPYLEHYWRDVHNDLVGLSRSALNAVLPPDLVARMEERVVVDSVQYDKPRAIYPEVRVYEDLRHGSSAGPAAAGGAAVAQPILLEFESEEYAEPYVTILNPEGGELVSVIEFLSPANKLPGEAREQFRRKRHELITANVNFVEIDLVRQGPWRELLLPMVAPANVQTPYRVITRRFHPSRRVELFPLRNRLPIIPIPLRQDDADVTLDLQLLFEQVYRNGRYNRTDYGRTCGPPLEGDDAAWADELLRTAGLRQAS